MERVFLIAGGSSGIGLAIVRQLLSEPETRVVVASRHPESVAGQPGLSAIPFDARGEAPSAGDLPEILHGFAYCPGSITLKPFHRLTDEDFLADLEINFLGAVRLLRSSLPALKKAGGAGIVLFSTVAVAAGMPYHASIASAKGAVEALVRSLAAELAPGIRVNAIAPSLTDTPLAASLLNTPEKAEAAAKRHPLRRVGEAGDAAALACFLLSEQAKFITGQVIAADGGLSSTRLL